MNRTTFTHPHQIHTHRVDTDTLTTLKDAALAFASRLDSDLQHDETLDERDHAILSAMLDETLDAVRRLPANL